MKKESIIYITDTHFKLDVDSRNDNFIETALNKIEYISKYAFNNNINNILFGGDLFDSPRPGYNLLNIVMNALKKEKLLNFYMIPGNHDLFGWSPYTAYRTAIAAVGNMSNVHLLQDKKLKILHDMGMPIMIYPIWADYDNEGNPDVLKLSQDQLEKTRDYYVIAMTHTMLVEKSFFGKFISFDQIPWQTTADLILGSHYHPGFPIKCVKINDKTKTVANPGALMRIAKTKNAISKIPNMLLMTFTGDINEIAKVELKYIPIEIAQLNPFKESFEVVNEKKLIEYDIQHGKFMKELLNSSVNSMTIDPKKLAKIIAEKEGMPSEVLRRAIQNLQIAEEIK